MSVTFQLQASQLTPVLTEFFGSQAKPNTHHIQTLKPGAGNPTSLGVYRVAGTAQVNNRIEPFSVVVKHLATGAPYMDASQPTYWNYYKREIAFFESQIATRIPETIGFPSYLGNTNLDDGTVLFWNSDLGDLEKSTWTWKLCLKAGELAADLNRIAVNLDEPWFNRGQVQWWIDYMRDNFIDLTEQIRAEVGDTENHRAYSPYLNRLPELLSFLKQGRQVFCHGDFNLNNLVPTENPDQPIIALDWQLCGVNAVGTELASIFNTAQELDVVDGTSEEFEELCRAYQRCFNELNPEPASINEVRYNAAAMGYIIVFVMGSWWAQPNKEKTDDENRDALLRVLNGSWSKTLVTYSRVLAEFM